MHEKFEATQQRELLNFYGRFPNGRPMISDPIPEIFKGGLLKKMLGDFIDLGILIPRIGSYDFREDLSFQLIHLPTEVF